MLFPTSSEYRIRDSLPKKDAISRPPTTFTNQPGSPSAVAANTKDPMQPRAATSAAKAKIDLVASDDNFVINIFLAFRLGGDPVSDNSTPLERPEAN